MEPAGTTILYIILLSITIVILLMGVIGDIDDDD